MSTRRALSVLLAALAATMLVTGSFGFTSVSAERGVAVNVVDSENAYVGVSVCEVSNGQGNDNGKGSNPVRVTVTNQFSDEFSVERIAAGGSIDDPGNVDSFGRSVESGESSTFKFKAHDFDEVTVEVSGGLDATVTTEIGSEQCSGMSPHEEEEDTDDTEDTDGDDGDNDTEDTDGDDNDEGEDDD